MKWFKGMSDGLSKQRIVEHIANSLQLREMAQLGKTSTCVAETIKNTKPWNGTAACWGHDVSKVKFDAKMKESLDENESLNFQ